MFETTGDQQSQSSVIVVSNNNVGNVVNGVVGGVDAHGAINALNDAIVDAITDQSHHLNHHLNNHSHINILSSYYYCKNLIEFPQFQSHHHHHHHVHYFNLNNNRFESASASSSSSSSATNQIKSSLVEQASASSPTTSVESSLDTNNNTTSNSLNDNCSFIIKDINNLINDAAHFGDASSKKPNLVLLKSSTAATSTPTQAENNDLISKINSNLSLSPFNSFQLSLTAISAEASTSNSPEQPKQHDENKSNDSKTEAEEAVEMQASSNLNNQISNTSNFDLVNDNIKLMEIVDNDASAHKTTTTTTTTTTTPIISNEKEMNKLCDFNSVSNSIKNYLLNESNSNNSISNTRTNENVSDLNCENNNISNKSMLDKTKLNKTKLIKMSNIPKRIGLRRNKSTVLFDSNSSCYNTRFKSRKFNSTLVNKRKYSKKIVNLVNNNNNNNNSSTTTSRLANSNGIRTRSQTKLASQLLTQGSSTTTPTASTNQTETITESELSSPTKTRKLKLKILNKRKRLRKCETNEPNPASKLENSKATPAANSNELVDYETALNNRSTDKLYDQSSIIETNEHLVNKPGNVVFNQLTDVQNDSRCFYYKSDSNVKISYNTNASSNSVAQSPTNTLGSFTNDFIYDQTAQMQLQHQQQQMQQMQPNESFVSNQQQFIYDIEMMPQHQQFFIDDNRSSIYSFVSNCNNTSQIKQDLLKLSYDKFKQFRLNEKLLQQTVLIRNAIKMLQCDIKFQQEQEQIFLQQQQQQQQMCLQQQQQQQKMEYDNSISNRLSPHQNLGQTMYNSSQPSIITMASYDNLEDFLTRSEFVNNSMLNTNNFNISNNRNMNSLNSTSNVNMNNATNNAGLNESGVGVNNLSCYYSDLNNNNANINNNNQNEQEHQIQLYNHTINDNSTTSINKNTNLALTNGYETNIDVETEEDEEENEDEAEYEEEDDEEEEEEEEDDEEEEEDEDEPNDEDEDDEDVDQESLNRGNNNNTIINKESNQNETNQIKKSELTEQYQTGSGSSQNTELTYFTQNVQVNDQNTQLIKDGAQMSSSASSSNNINQIDVTNTQITVNQIGKLNQNESNDDNLKMNTTSKENDYEKNTNQNLTPLDNKVINNNNSTSETRMLNLNNNNVQVITNDTQLKSTDDYMFE